MRKALFRKDLWKDVSNGPKGGKEEPVEKPTLHQHKYLHTRRMRVIGILQIVTGTFLFFVSITLPVFGARNWLTSYLIPIGCVNGPLTTLTGIFCRETCRKRANWAVIVYIILCSFTSIASFVLLIGAFIAFGKERQGWAEDLITEHVIAFFRTVSYAILIFLSMAIISYAVLNIMLDCRRLNSTCRSWITCQWLPEVEVEDAYDEEDGSEVPVTEV